MMSMMRYLVISSGFMSACALAQQPGSAEYNSVYLPAHGVGDTVRQGVRWGALARGSNLTLGWSVGSATEEQAVALATQDCIARGGLDCERLQTFSNVCAAVAVGPENRRYVGDTKSLSRVRKRALKDCGSPECKILFEGCALP